MVFSLKKLVAGSLAALMLLQLPLAAQAGGFNFGNSGYRSGGSNYRMPTNTGVRSSYRPITTFKANTFSGWNKPAWQSTGVRTTPTYRPMVQNKIVTRQYLVPRTKVVVRPQPVATWRKTQTVLRQPVLGWKKPVSNWQQGNALGLRARMGVRTYARPAFIRNWTRGPVAWRWHTCRARSGCVIINSCAGITPYVPVTTVDPYAGFGGEGFVDAGAQQFSGGEIKIIAGADMPGNIGYLLNGTEYDMKPGFSQKFVEDRTWVIQFRSGDETSDVVEYTLNAGTYQFVVADGKLALTPVGPEGLQPSDPAAQQQMMSQQMQQVLPQQGQPVDPNQVQQFDPNQVDPNQAQQFDPNQVDPNQAQQFDPNQLGQNQGPQFDPNQVDPNQAQQFDPNQMDPNQMQFDPNQINPNQMMNPNQGPQFNPNQFNPNQVNPNQFNGNQMNPNQVPQFNQNPMVRNQGPQFAPNGFNPNQVNPNQMPMNPNAMMNPNQAPQFKMNPMAAGQVQQFKPNPVQQFNQIAPNSMNTGAPNQVVTNQIPNQAAPILTAPQAGASAEDDNPGVVP